MKWGGRGRGERKMGGKERGKRYGGRQRDTETQTQAVHSSCDKRDGGVTERERKVETRGGERNGKRGRGGGSGKQMKISKK